MIFLDQTKYWRNNFSVTYWNRHVILNQISDLFYYLLQYRFFGEPVVKACVENGTSCIDISGEPQVCRIEKTNWSP